MTPALVNQAVSGLGGLDILVKNAGRQQSHDSILDITTEQFDWTLRTNPYAMFWITKAAIPHMPPGSAIINKNSVNAYDPSAKLLDYAMTKATIANFTKDNQTDDQARHPRQCGGEGRRCKWVVGRLQRTFRSSASRYPMGRPGNQPKIAPVYVQLASAQSSYMTGRVYGASGGGGQP
jgi:NAD(P)-dependent dehydrogenase (short-subunit alcohol dehydrogenase family)